MGTTVLDFQVTAQDQASQAFDKVAATLEKLQGKIDGTVSKGAAVGSFFGSLGGNLLSSGIEKASAVVSDFLGGSIEQASNLNETLSASSVVFGEQAKAVQEWSLNASKNLGLSRQAALDAAVGFGDMFLQLGATGDQARKNSEDIVQLAADLGSFRNVPTGEVLDMISGAMRGEYDSLQRLIPNISAARVETEALTETGKASAAQLTAQEKAQATLSIIQKDGARATGDFARTSEGAANSSKILQASIEDQQAALGAQLMPVYQQFQRFLIDDLIPAISAVLGWMQQNPTAIQAIAVALGVLTLAFVGVTIATWALNTALLANPITWIILGIVALIAALVLLIMNWDNVVKFLAETWMNFVSWLSGVMQAFGDWWNAFWSAIGQLVQQAWNDWIVNPIRGAVQWLVDMISAAMQLIQNVWNGVWTGLGDVVRGVWNGILDLIEGGVNNAIRLINGLIGAANAVGGLVGIRLGLIPDVHIPRLATGGSIVQGGIAVVGERGPELVSLPTGSRVHPTGTGPGDTVVTVNVTSQADAFMIGREVGWALRAAG